ncbi:MAG: tRNA (adenosine(37)-N6)-threonylcarbamoyltransferase complex ATPase subunit type 1 TsaE [Acidimicrobiales bacterium]|nr:tRNA (adenosine(37)-N6)-threonylcarbamoyltransferase complex ATPase subunit type 1 TsaE [Acidimicrobiales bacterium]
MTIVVHTSSADQTRAVAAGVAGLARAGDVVILVGDLGAGKTAFAQGFGAALGVTDPITSPTFTLARRYQGRLILHHLDVYRLGSVDEALDLALPELIDSDSVTLVEWGDTILPALPQDLLEIRLTFGPGDDDRVIALAPGGPRWTARSDALARALDSVGLDGGAESGAEDEGEREVRSC